MSRKKLLIIFSILLSVVLVWVWAVQNDYFNNDDNVRNIEDGTASEQNLSVQILSPANNAVINSGPLSVQYVLSGGTTSVQRVDLELIKDGELVIIVPGSYNTLSKTGNQLVSTVEEGDYILRIKLVNQTGEYFESAETTSESFFRVQNSYVGQ